MKASPWPAPKGSWPATSRRRLLIAVLCALMAHVLALSWVALAGLYAPEPAEPVLVLHARTQPGQTAPAPTPRMPRPAKPAHTSRPPAARSATQAEPAPSTSALTAPATSPQAVTNPASETVPDGPRDGAREELAPAPQVVASDAPGEAGKQAPAPRLSLPPAARLRYQLTGVIKGLTYYARGTLDWQHDEARYRLRMDIGAFLLGSRQQLSEGEVTASGLRPRRFSDRVHGERTVDFDPAQGVIRFSEGAEPVPWFAEAQDQLSVFVQVGSLLLGSDPAYQPGETLDLPAVGVYGPERWAFKVEPDETLTLDDQALITRKVRRVARNSEEPTIELWFAPAWGGLPVRLRLTQGTGDAPDQIDQVLSSRTKP